MTTQSLATMKQPAPTGNGETVHIKVLERLSEREWSLLADDIRERAEMGKANYGTYLKTHNGREALVDLYQELLDAIAYATQVDIECNGNDDTVNSEMVWIIKYLACEVKERLLEIR